MFSPASRASAAVTSTISWRAPAQPTAEPSRPRSATRHLVDRLVLRRHDPLERGIARLDDAGGHAHDRGQRALDLVVARFGLALHLHRAARDLDVLRERHRGQAEELGDLLGHRAGVPVGRFGRGEDRDRGCRCDRSPWRAPSRSTASRNPAARDRTRGLPWPRPSPARCADPTPRCSAPSTPA